MAVTIWLPTVATVMIFSDCWFMSALTQENKTMTTIATWDVFKEALKQCNFHANFKELNKHEKLYSRTSNEG